MELARKSQVVALIARVSLGVWFVYSGGVKIFGSGLDRFTYDISNYKIVPAPWDAAVAYTLPWFELIAGVCLMLGILRKGAILTVTGLVVAFSIAVGWAWSHGLDISCGCHGGDAPIRYWNKAAEFAGYFLLLGWLWWMERRARFCAARSALKISTPASMTYAERLQKRIDKTGSRLCVGLDPRPGDGGAAFAENFLKQVIEETSLWAAAYKPNMAYFEAMGIEGIRLLEHLLASMPDDIPVILDAKRSDIGETQKCYAQGYFAGWNVDAVTLNPFLGYDSIEPFLDWEGKGIYLLAVTSNAGSADFQQQKLADGRSVFELVTALGDRAKSEGRKTDVGYVVGLTNAADVLEKIPDAPLLVPGLGAQGGDLASLAAAGRTAPDVINVSRGILYAADERGFGARARDWAEKIAAAYGK